MRWIAGLSLFLAASHAAQADELIGARVRAWYAQLDGHISSDEPAVEGSDINIASDLGLDGLNWAYELQAYVRIPIVGRIYLGWWQDDVTGNQTLSRSITFNGQTFSASSDVHTELSLDVFYLTYEFAFPLIPLGNLIDLEIGAELGVRGLKGHGTIDAAGFSESDGGTVGLPVLGVHASLELFGWLRTEVEIIGLAASYSGYSLSYLEASAEVVGKIAFFFAGFGYKWANIEFESKDDNKFNANVEISGFYFTVGARF